MAMTKWKIPSVGVLAYIMKPVSIWIASSGLETEVVGLVYNITYNEYCCFTVNCTHHIQYIHYHVCYSISFSQPVCYYIDHHCNFRASTRDFGDRCIAQVVSLKRNRIVTVVLCMHFKESYKIM